MEGFKLDISAKKEPEEKKFQDDDEDEVQRIDDVEPDPQQQLDIEEENKEIAMEFGGEEIQRKNSGQSEEDFEDEVLGPVQ